MNIALAYTHIIGQCPGAPPPEHYAPGVERFLSTYLKYKPTQPHQFVVINCNVGKSNGMFDGVATQYVNYYGGGWDFGAYRQAAGSVDCDFLICFNAWTYFWVDNWLSLFMSAFETYGIGVYSPSASYENGPHLRNPCLAFTPKLMLDYPQAINNRDMNWASEAGPKSFSRWLINEGITTKLITPVGCFDWRDWRKPDNIFRRGDQSNVVVRDRHTLIYDQATPEEKLRLEAAADILKA